MTKDNKLTKTKKQGDNPQNSLELLQIIEQQLEDIRYLMEDDFLSDSIRKQVIYELEEAIDQIYFIRQQYEGI